MPEERELKLRGEYITLGQLLKAADLASDGAEAKYLILDGKAKVNGETELRRGRKLYAGDTVAFGGTEIRVVR